MLKKKVFFPKKKLNALFLKKMNFCSAINHKIIHSHQNDDVMGELQAINQYSLDKKNIRCLVMSPTGDLAYSLATLPNVISVVSVDNDYSQVK